jgi:hypothetical protein
MNIAIITATGQQAEIIAVNGGWTTVRPIGHTISESIKVRNGALSGHTTLTDTVAEMAKAAAEEPARGAQGLQDMAQAQVVTERKNGKIDPLYLQFYTSYAVELADGTTRRSIDKGDALAVKLRGMELISVYAEVSNITGQSITDLRARFTHLNPGMQRMSLGNMARKFMKAAV